MEVEEKPCFHEVVVEPSSWKIKKTYLPQTKGDNKTSLFQTASFTLFLRNKSNSPKIAVGHFFAVLRASNTNSILPLWPGKSWHCRNPGEKVCQANRGNSSPDFHRGVGQLSWQSMEPLHLASRQEQPKGAGTRPNSEIQHVFLGLF